jgi:hypothetical protein
MGSTLLCGVQQVADETDVTESGCADYGLFFGDSVGMLGGLYIAQYHLGAGAIISWRAGGRGGALLRGGACAARRADRAGAAAQPSPGAL